MEKRAPRKMVFDFPDVNSTPVYVYINAHLFDWVLENLMRNALDAMDGEGVIKAFVSLKDDHINIDLSDTGKGIPPSKWKAVFQPGYTTKKRGWGLGLSLAQRIIESYHKGKIFVRVFQITNLNLREIDINSWGGNEIVCRGSLLLLGVI